MYLQKLFAFRCLIIMGLLPYYGVFSSGPHSTEQNSANKLSKLPEANYCSGDSCTHMHPCIGSYIYHEDDNFMSGICELMLQELSDVLFNDAVINKPPINTLKLTIRYIRKSSSSNSSLQ